MCGLTRVHEITTRVNHGFVPIELCWGYTVKREMFLLFFYSSHDTCFHHTTMFSRMSTVSCSYRNTTMNVNDHYNYRHTRTMALTYSTTSGLSSKPQQNNEYHQTTIYPPGSTAKKDPVLLFNNLPRQFHRKKREQKAGGKLFNCLYQIRMNRILLRQLSLPCTPSKVKVDTEWEGLWAPLPWRCYDWLRSARSSPSLSYTGEQLAVPWWGERWWLL